MGHDPNQITRLVSAWSDGDEVAFDRLIDLVYEDLRRIAQHHIRLGSRDVVLNTTMLVHEAYLRIARVDSGEWPSRAQFFAFCSKVMRRVLIDFARKRRSQKRGGGQIRVTLGDEAAALEADTEEILALEDALQRLEEKSPRMARIVECRFYGGMSVPETAEALSTSKRTVEREWTRARAYLRQAMAAEGPQ